MSAAPTLPALQRLFQDHVLSAAAGIEAWTSGDARADAGRRLGVYFDAYRLRLLEVLENDYPALKVLLGEERFAELGRAYIEAHPSTTPSVRWFGRHLADFLAGADAPAVAAELARFEWTQLAVSDAADAPAVAVEAMAGIPPEAWPGMRLQVLPAVHRLDLQWNTPAICEAAQASKPLPAAEVVNPARSWLLWRNDKLDVHWRSLSAEEAAAIDAVLAGASFGEICERLCEWVAPEQAGLHAASLLKRWLVDGLIAEVLVES